MARSTHRIKRQIMDLQLARRALAPIIQDQASRVHKHRLLPLIDRICTNASPPGQIDRIQRIELDLGEISASELEDELVTRLSRALTEALQREITRNQRRSRASGGPPIAIQSALELFAVFARTGQVPWWADGRQAGLLASNLTKLLRQAPTRIADLVVQLGDQPESLKRVAAAYDDRLLAELFGVLAPSARFSDISRHGSESAKPLTSAALATSLVAVVRSAAGALERTPDRTRAAAWHSALQVVSRDRRRSFEALCKEVLIVVALKLGVTYRALVGQLCTAIGGAASPTTRGPRCAVVRVIEALDARIPRQKTGSQTESVSLSESPSISESLSESESESESVSISESLSESPSLSASEPRRPPEAPFDVSPFTAADEIYVHDSGLVLLSPFFGHFFRHVGLREDDQLRDRAARHRAVGLLHHLVTEAPAPTEYQVPLAKLLCGVALDDVIEFGDPISDAEAQECHRFIEAMIGHAPILNNMSVAGFRAGFLARDGVLAARHGEWLLRVEYESYDVVLDHLPWSVDWVKQPWMTPDTLLRVEWTAP